MWFGLLQVAFAQDVQQSLVYDLTRSGEPVGQCTVKISYIPPTETSSSVRVIDAFTEVEFSIAGRTIQYQASSNARFSDAGTRFGSIVSVNNERFEIQGKQLSDNSWLVREILPSGMLKENYSAFEIQTVSLALFDPGQSQQWEEGPQAIYVVEIGDIWDGSWLKGKERKIQNSGVTLTGQESRYTSDQGVYTGAWSTDGLLLDFELMVKGVQLDANLRNLPVLPDFGEVNVDVSFEGVQEEAL